MSTKIFRSNQAMVACINRYNSTYIAPEKAFDASNRPTPSLANTPLKYPKYKVINPPSEVTEAFHQVVQKERLDLTKQVLKDYLASGLNMVNFYMNRTLPMNGWYGKVKKNQIESILAKKFGDNLDDPETEERIKQSMNHHHKMRASRWKLVEYDNEAAWSYFIGTKAAYDFACMKNILSEIKFREETFQPKTLLDFGSGVGTVTWAVKDVFGEPYEVFNVDSSKHMNDFSRMIINKSRLDDDLPSGYSYRFNLPRDSTTKYDLVTCSFTLLDLLNERQRLTYVDTLWHRVAEGGFLILTEVGTHSGYQTINEARELLCYNFEKTDYKGHIFAPCPHESICPRQIEKKHPCSFSVRFRNFPFNGLTNAQNDTVFNGKYSYIVAQKGTSRNTSSDWPRLVENPICKGGRVTCRICTSRGKLEEILTTNTKDGKNIVRYCKSKQLGQQIKLNLNDKSQHNTLVDPQLEQILEDRKSKQLEQQILKGQLISKFLICVIVWTKMSTKKIYLFYSIVYCKIVLCDISWLPTHQVLNR